MPALSSQTPKKDRRRQAVLPRHLLGAKQLAPLQKLLETLQAMPAHGNRTLHLDQLLVLHLLGFFNPVVRSLRMLEDLSQTPLAKKLLDAERVPRSTLSDIHAIADPQLLRPVLESLLALMPKSTRLTDDLAMLQREILACDASYYTTVSNLAWAIQQRRSNQKRHARVALHIQYNAGAGVPVGVQVAGHAESEAEVVSRNLVPGAIHVMDRGYVSFKLLETIQACNADFVLRLTTQIRFSPSNSRELSKQDRESGIVSDEEGILTGCDKSDPPKGQLRLVTVIDQSDPTQTLRLLTSITDMTAAQIARLYRWRWQIELYFRWLKTYAHFDHLLSHSQKGAEWAFYISVIGVVLLALYEGKAPRKYDLAMLSIVVAGGATLEEILPILRRRHRERELAGARDARRTQSHPKK